MKKSGIALLALLVFISLWTGGALLGFPGFANLALASFIGVVLVIACFYLRFEESGSDSRMIALIGAVSALSIAGRVFAVALPGAEPSTFIIIAGGYVLGPLNGFMIGATTALISNLFLGHGPWTPWQMLAWGLAGLASGLLGKRKHLEGRLLFSFYSGGWAILFGWIVNLYFILGFVRPINLQSVVATFGASLVFDLSHFTATWLYAFFLGPALIAMLRRYRTRLDFEHLGSSGPVQTCSPFRAPADPGVRPCKEAGFPP